MSAFVVKQDSINRIVTFFQILENKTKACTRRGVLSYIESPFSFVKANGEVSVKKTKKLARQMFDLNVEAVNYRYQNDPDMIPDSFEYEPLEMDAENESLIAKILSNLDCLLYQCSEGKVPEKSLYKELEKFSTKLAGAIARNTPAYERAEWG